MKTIDRDNPAYLGDGIWKVVCPMCGETMELHENIIRQCGAPVDAESGELCDTILRAPDDAWTEPGEEPDPMEGDQSVGIQSEQFGEVQDDDAAVRERIDQAQRGLNHVAQIGAMMAKKKRRWAQRKHNGVKQWRKSKSNRSAEKKSRKKNRR